MQTSSNPGGGRRRALIAGAGVTAVGVIAASMIWVLRPDEPTGGPVAAAAPAPAGSTSRSVTVSKAPASGDEIVLPGSSPTDSRLVGGQIDHLAFARSVAQALLAYAPDTDFASRNADLLRAAAPAPYGDPGMLAQDLIAFTPDGPALESLRADRTTVTVEVTDAAVSQWAANRLEGIGVSPGVYGIDVTGRQTITGRSGNPTRVAVQLGVTVACPPATSFCTLDRVLPQHLQAALGSG